MRDVDHWERYDHYKEADAPAARAFADPKVARITEILELGGGEPVLDVGAGTGHLGEGFARRGHPVTAFDATQLYLRRNPAARRVRGDAARLPFPDRSFPLVIESNLLHHVDDPVTVLREMARVSAGPVALVEPNRNHPPMFLFSLLVREEWPALRFRPRHVRRLAERAGLVPLLVEARGWVYQNKTPAALAGWLGRIRRSCPVAAYVLGVFQKERNQ